MKRIKRNKTRKGTRKNNIRSTRNLHFFPSFSLQVTQAGAYHYLCTRNNNFSNRQQKGRILVVEGEIHEFEVGKRGTVFNSRDIKLTVPPMAFQTVVKLRLQRRLSMASAPHKAISDFFTLTPAETRVEGPKPMTVEIQLDANSLKGASQWF